MKSVFSAGQRRIIWGCVVAYILAYLTRLNLSATLSSIIESMGISPAQAGLLQTCFAIVYATGQLVSGSIVDRVNPVRYMLLGLAGTSLCNMAMSAVGQYWMLLALCLMNGAFQSMLWTPIVRLVAMHFPEGAGRVRANFMLSVTLAIGHFGAWAISGFLSGTVGWRFSFLVPGAIVFLMWIVIYRLLRGANRGDGRARQQKADNPSLGEGLRVFARTGFFFILAGCVLYGFARDGIVTWAPEILHGLSAGNQQLAASFSLIIPAINLIGILIGYYFRFHSHQNSRGVVAIMLPLTALFCLPLLPQRSLLPTAIFMGSACACLYGMNPMLTSLIPMEYDRFRCVGLAAGLIDSFIYLGSALSGFGEGMVYEAAGTGGLYVSWIVLSLGAAVFMIISRAKNFETGMQNGKEQKG